MAAYLRATIAKWEKWVLGALNLVKPGTGSLARRVCTLRGSYEHETGTLDIGVNGDADSCFLRRLHKDRQDHGGPVALSQSRGSRGRTGD
jgi:hypothetical protein